MKTIALVAQKGGVGKTMSSVHLGIGMARQGKKVLLIDADPQGTMTRNLGFREANQLSVTLHTFITQIITGETLTVNQGILHHTEGVDIIPANINLSGAERDLTISNDRGVLAKCIESIKADYDYALFDTMPSLGAITLNVLTAADSVIIPVQARYEASQGLEQLMRTVANTRRSLNRNIRIDGILLTMVDERSNLTKQISTEIRAAYGSHLRIFPNHIPQRIRLAETAGQGKSIFAYAPNDKGAQAYEAFVKEVLHNGEKERTAKSRSDLLR